MSNSAVQRGFSPIVILVVVAVVLVGGVLVFDNLRSQNIARKNAQSVNTTTSTNSGSASDGFFAKKEGDRYVFYYPNFFKDTKANVSSDYELYYVDTKSDRTAPAFIWLNVSRDPKVKAGVALNSKFDLAKCQKYVDYVKQSSDETTVRVNVVNDDLSSGCEFITKTPVPYHQDAVVVVSKILLPLITQESILQYQAKAGYFESDRTEVSHGLELSIDKFVLK